MDGAISGPACDRPEVSVVMPCLNEEEAIPVCVNQIRKGFQLAGVDGEIVICDNGSTDRSVTVAEGLGVRVVHEPARGYGRAYRTGFAAARGRIFVMGDADATYDFSMIPLFLQSIRAGNDFVTGSRYANRGHRHIVLWHRVIGNPVLTLLLNLLFGCRYSDVYCGYRAFTAEAYRRIRPVSPGMEFNLELAINARLAGLRVAEIPIELGPRKGVSKLRTLRDGWRSLRMMLLYCPNKVFWLPGAVLCGFGGILHGANVLGALSLGDATPDLPLGTLATIASVTGFQILSLGLHAKTYSWSRRFDSGSPSLVKFYSIFKLEAGLAIGLALLVGGGVAWAMGSVGASGSVALVGRGEPLLLLGTTLIIVGVQALFASLFISAMSMAKD